MNEKKDRVTRSAGKRRVLDVVLVASFAALYTLLVYVFASVSFLQLQVRIADALMPLTILFGWPATLGLSLGCFVANFFGGLGLVDVIGGGLANLIAGFVGWKIGSMKFNGSWVVAVLTQNLIVSFIVGSYLWVLLVIPDLTYGSIVIPGIVASWVGVFLGSLVSMNGLGYAILKALSTRTRGTEPRP
jgi:uncharacterized membrane protein